MRLQAVRAGAAPPGARAKEAYAPYGDLPRNDKDTGRIAVYPLQMEIDDRILGALKVRATMNPELRYFVLVSARWEKYGTVTAGILKRRSVTRADVDNIGGIVEL